MAAKRRKRGKIRVGVVHCDLHAVWYGAFIQASDPWQIFEHFKIVHYYFYDMRLPERLVIPEVPGFEIVKCWDPERKKAELYSRVFKGRPQVCETLEEASDDVDLVFVADCLGQGKEHLAWARPGLNKGVPTFVDKPFAYTLKDAKAMVRLAKRRDTPMLSLSLAREIPEGKHFRSRFKEIEPVVLGTIRGAGAGNLGGVIHTLSLAQDVFGTGVESVNCMGDVALEFIRLHYPGDVHGIEVMCMSPRTVGPNCAAFAAAYTRAGDFNGKKWVHKTGFIHSDPMDDWAFLDAGAIILKKVKKMVRTHEPVEPYEHMLELMRIVEAARISQRTGKGVKLKDVR